MLQVQTAPIPPLFHFFLSSSFSHQSSSFAPRCPFVRALHQRWGYRCTEQASFSCSVPPSLLPELGPYLIGWCRFTVTGWPGEPLVSSLYFQNISLNVLLSFLSHIRQTIAYLYCYCLFYVIPDTFSSNIWCDCLDNPKWGISVTPDPDSKINHMKLHPAQNWDQTPKK